MSLSNRLPNEAEVSRSTRSLPRQYSCDEVAVRRVIIVGATDGAQGVAETLAASKRPRYEVVGFLTEAGSDPVLDPRVLGEASQMFEIARELNVDEIIVATVPDWQRRMAEAISSSSNGHPKVRLVPSAYDAMVSFPKLAHIDDLPVMTLGSERSMGYRFIKRAFDIGFSVAALAVTSPLLLGVAAIIKLTSDGPVFYSQERVGKGGKPFLLFKLRTMVVDAEKCTGPTLAKPRDGRVTAIGRILRRLKIDELPQFINTLKGEMSVIGPRPERPCFVDQYCDKIPGYRARHRARPGITGLAQVYGGYATDPETKLKYDLMYVFGSSIWMDLRVILLTLPAMLSGR